jgi:hypothetical protein
MPLGYEGASHEKNKKVRAFVSHANCSDLLRSDRIAGRRLVQHRFFNYSVCRLERPTHASNLWALPIIALIEKFICLNTSEIQLAGLVNIVQRARLQTRNLQKMNPSESQETHVP